MTARSRDCEGFHRRDFLKLGAGGLLGLSLADLLRLKASAAAPAGQGRRANAIIMIWLAGGPASIDMWDLKPSAPEGIRGAFRPIATKVSGLEICEHLPQMARAVDKTTVVRSLYHTVPAHGPATLFMTTGNAPTPALQYPALGSLAARLLPAARGVPPYISFGELRSGAAGQAGYLGPTYNPFIVEGLGGGKGKKTPAKASTPQVRGILLPAGFTLEELENRAALMQAFDHGLKALDHSSVADGLDAFHRMALEILTSDRSRKAFDLDQEPTVMRERYGLDGFGQGVLTARRLVEAGVRFVTVTLGGWDTHQKNFEILSKALLPQVDRTLSALLEDLDGRGLLGQTIVYCAGEFGRTPRVNQNAGRDHWARSMAVILAGGGFRRGYLHGSTDAQGMAPTLEPCIPDDLAATLFHCLGLDPRQELRTPTRRPVQLFREGQIIHKMLA